jgi:transcriptional regulator with XRE-family HTH domain
MPGFFVFNPAKLRAAREALSLSQHGLSFEARVAAPLIWSYEAGVRTPSRETLDRLAAALSVSPADLCDEDPSFQAVAR